MTDFENYTQAAEAAKNHEQEIKQTRVGGLGGSDAEMLARIGRNGLSALSATDAKRLGIMLGLVEQDNWGGNAYTNAGHAFEDWAEKAIPNGVTVTMQREELLEQPLARNFRTFAHADFTVSLQGSKDKGVIECKYVQKTTDEVEKTYAAQLQWYYIMGATNVSLFHGCGSVEPFKVEDTAVRLIERDEELIETILAGIKTLDEAIADGWKPVAPDKVHVDDTTTPVRDAFATLQRIKREREQLDEQEAQAKAVLLSYMQDFTCNGITDDLGNQVTLTKESKARTFDSAKFLKEHAEYNVDAFYKTTTRKASVTFKPAKQAEA